jgi:4-hydroxythreonine-4-phosphate dehydrogenase
MKKIVITTGDEDGIGLEVTLKALKEIGPQKKFVFVVFISKKIKSFRLPGFKSELFKNLNSALESSPKFKNSIFLIYSPNSPAKWVEQAATACFQKKAFALVTGPLSKPKIKSSGLKDLGHTEILKRITKSKSVKMCFIGRYFNVVLATGHIPISKVSSRLQLEDLKNCIQNTNNLRKTLSLKKPLALIGLNPHAGDQGLIGNEELILLNRVIAASQKIGIPLEGPLVPDVAFNKKNWKKYSFFIACYHDQGLIPFKMAHGFSGVHYSLGLPIIRTSVDHGTAQDIFGKNLADPSSMKDAIKWAIKFSN